METGANGKTRGYEACSGCGICAMSCPVWWETRDVWFTPHGRARALQGGATAGELADSVISCRMCGACEPVCPESIDVMGMVRQLRVDLDKAGLNRFTREPPAAAARNVESDSIASGARLLLSGPEFDERPALLADVVACLGGAERTIVATDDGRDLAWAFEAGASLDRARLDRWLTGLRGARELVVLDGILHFLLREYAPALRVRGLADALLDGASILDTLGPRDFLVITARAYHADHDRLVRSFSRLRSRTGCQMNLDLQRVAIPSGADSLQAREVDPDSCRSAIDWMLEGREIDRIVVETAADLDVLAAATSLPVVHLATLASEGGGS